MSKKSCLPTFKGIRYESISDIAALVEKPNYAYEDEVRRVYLDYLNTGELPTAEGFKDFIDRGKIPLEEVVRLDGISGIAEEIYKKLPERTRTDNIYIDFDRILTPKMDDSISIFSGTVRGSTNKVSFGGHKLTINEFPDIEFFVTNQEITSASIPNSTKNNKVTDTWRVYFKSGDKLVPTDIVPLSELNLTPATLQDYVNNIWSAERLKSIGITLVEKEDFFVKWRKFKNANPDGAIMAYKATRREKAPFYVIGNPNSIKELKTGTPEEKGIFATKQFIDYILFSQAGQPIRNLLDSGVLKGKPIYYYKEFGHATHATVLDYFINNWDDLKQYVKIKVQNPPMTIEMQGSIINNVRVTAKKALKQDVINNDINKIKQGATQFIGEGLPGNYLNGSPDNKTGSSSWRVKLAFQKHRLANTGGYKPTDLVFIGTDSGDNANKTSIFNSQGDFIGNYALIVDAINAGSALLLDDVETMEENNSTNDRLLAKWLEENTDYRRVGNTGIFTLEGKPFVGEEIKSNPVSVTNTDEEKQNRYSQEEETAFNNQVNAAVTEAQVKQNVVEGTVQSIEEIQQEMDAISNEIVVLSELTGLSEDEDYLESSREEKIAFLMASMQEGLTDPNRELLVSKLIEYSQLSNQLDKSSKDLEKVVNTPTTPLPTEAINNQSTTTDLEDRAQQIMSNLFLSGEIDPNSSPEELMAIKEKIKQNLINEQLDSLNPNEEPTNIEGVKPGVEELFDSNPELANQVYKTLGFQGNINLESNLKSTGKTEQELIEYLKQKYPEIKLNISNNPVWEQGDNIFNQLIEDDYFEGNFIKYQNEVEKVSNLILNKLKFKLKAFNGVYDKKITSLEDYKNKILNDLTKNIGINGISSLSQLKDKLNSSELQITLKEELETAKTKKQEYAEKLESFYSTRRLLNNFLKHFDINKYSDQQQLIIKTNLPSLFKENKFKSDKQAIAFSKRQINSTEWANKKFQLDKISVFFLGQSAKISKIETLINYFKIDKQDAIDRIYTVVENELNRREKFFTSEKIQSKINAKIAEDKIKADNEKAERLRKQNEELNKYKNSTVVQEVEGFLGSRNIHDLEDVLESSNINVELATIKNNGYSLDKTPEGKESNLFKSILNLPEVNGNIEIAKKLKSLVYSEDFINWFGDWLTNPEESSKVVDENGEPKLVYHGSGREFSNFEEKERGSTTGKWKDRLSDSEMSFMFTDSPTTAFYYAIIERQAILKEITYYVRKSAQEPTNQIIQEMYQKYPAIKNWVEGLKQKGLTRDEILKEFNRVYQEYNKIRDLSEGGAIGNQEANNQNTKQIIDYLEKNKESILRKGIPKNDKYNTAIIPNSDKNGHPIWLWSSKEYNTISVRNNGILNNFTTKSLNGKNIQDLSSNEYDLMVEEFKTNFIYNYEKIQDEIKAGGFRPKIYPVFLNAKNINQKDFKGRPFVFQEGDTEDIVSKRQSKGAAYEVADLIEEALNNNLDGSVIENIADPTVSTNYAVFKSNQIKSIFNKKDYTSQDDFYNQLSNGEIIGQANIKAMTVLVDAVNKKADTIPHEYAHHYIAWFRNTPIVQGGIKRFGSEEALVQAIGEQVVKQKGEAYNWWKKFTNWILNLLSDKQLLQILTDSFLNRQDLNDFTYNQITPQQKQQVLQQYSQYLNTIFPGSKVKDIEGFTNFQLSSEEGIKVSEKSIKDLAAKISDRIGIPYKIINKKDELFKGKIENDVAVINLAYATLDTPIHEILGHPIIRAIKNKGLQKPKIINDVDSFFTLNGSEYVFEKNTNEYFKDGKEISKQEFDNAVKKVEQLNNQSSQLYQNLLKELEYGRGKEVLDRIKRSYAYKEAKEKDEIKEVNKYGYSLSDFVDTLVKIGYSTDQIIKDIKAIYPKVDEEYMYFNYSEPEPEFLGDKINILTDRNTVYEKLGLIGGKNIYTLEEQQEEAIVELLSMMTAEKLDAVKDGKLISLLKRLLKEMKEFIRSLLTFKEVEIDKLPDNITLGDLSDLLAYSNSKLILPGYEVEYTTPDNKKFKTYTEASNHISQLVKNIKEVDLSNIKSINLFNGSIDPITGKKINKAYLFEEKSYYGNDDDSYTEDYKYRLIFEDGTENIVDDYYDLVVKYGNNKQIQEFYNKIKENSDLIDFIEKNKQYEISKEIINKWKKVNNIQYNPEEIYSRGQEFVSVLGAYSNFDFNLLMQNLLQHIEDNQKAGGEFIISAFTKPVDRTIGHLEGGGSKIKFKIYPQSNDIKWASNTDVYSGSVWDASEKISKNKKSELLGVSYSKYPGLKNIHTVKPNLASIVDDLAHHHNELGISLNGTNFRLEYDEDIPYQTKKIIDSVNSILDEKYGKLVKPEISIPQRKILSHTASTLDGKYVAYLKGGEEQTFNTKNELDDFIKSLKQIGTQPTQTEDNLKESFENVFFEVIDTSGEFWYHESDGYWYLKYFDEVYAVYNSEKELKKDYDRLMQNKKEYTTQALINTKIAKLKEVIKKYPRALIRSEVKKSFTPNYKNRSKLFNENEILFQKSQTPGFKEKTLKTSLSEFYKNLSEEEKMAINNLKDNGFLTTKCK